MLESVNKFLLDNIGQFVSINKISNTLNSNNRSNSVNTIENLVKGVVSGFGNVTSANCKVHLNKQINNVKVDLNLTVAADTVIKELSLNIQDRIKEVVKRTTELEIKEINIKIKDIERSKVEVKD